MKLHSISFAVFLLTSLGSLGQAEKLKSDFLTGKLGISPVFRELNILSQTKKAIVHSNTDKGFTEAGPSDQNLILYISLPENELCTITHEIFFELNIHAFSSRWLKLAIRSQIGKSYM